MALVVGHTLYVHGGFDGRDHMDDLWALDMRSWAWAEVAPKVGSPRGPLPLLTEINSCCIPLNRRGGLEYRWCRADLVYCTYSRRVAAWSTSSLCPLNAACRALLHLHVVGMRRMWWLAGTSWCMAALMGRGTWGMPTCWTWSLAPGMSWACKVCTGRDLHSSLHDRRSCRGQFDAGMQVRLGEIN